MESDDQAPKSRPSTSDLPLNFCPVCSEKLESQHCKMVCRRCGYFMSCSEFE